MPSPFSVVKEVISINLMTPDILLILKEFMAQHKYYRCYQLREWRKVRAEAIRRDNYECQDCKVNGRYTKAMEVHHIVDKKTNIEMFLDLNNLVCLCKDCHNKRHDKLKQNKPKFTNEERW